MKERLDVLLVQRGLAPSREKAKVMIMEGNVFVESQREDKAGTFFDSQASIEVRGNTLKYVSRDVLFSKCPHFPAPHICPPRRYG